MNKLIEYWENLELQHHYREQNDRVKISNYSDLAFLEIE